MIIREIIKIKSKALNSGDLMNYRISIGDIVCALDKLNSDQVEKLRKQSGFQDDPASHEFNLAFSLNLSTFLKNF